MKKKMILIGMGGLLAVTAAAGILFWALRDDGEETVYREAAAVVGNLTVGVKESGSVEIGTKEDTFDLDISALVRDSSDSDSQSSQSSQTAAGAGGGGGMDMGGMNMFNQIFSFASEQSQTAVTSDNTLTVASVEVFVGQEISAGDVLYVLEGDSVSEIAEKLESDVKKAETDLEAAYAEERWSLFDGVIQDCAVVAEYDGIVTNVYFEAGDTIQTGDTLVTLYDLEDVTMTVTVAEEDMTDIAKGSAANVVLTAYPDEVFTAVVSDISDASADSSGNVTYEVTVTLQGDEVRKLYQGMMGDVTFITEEVREVLYVPVRAVTEENDKSYVKIKDADGSVRKVEVTTGFTDGVYIEIPEGLEEGEIVLIESVVKD